MNNKSRNIPLVELYRNLQFEFLSYYVRSKTYRKDYADYVDNYVKICDQKKEKIEGIRLRNNLPSIFSDESMKERYINEFLGKSGVPMFSYRDEEIKRKMQKWDRFYFFMKGTSVSIKEDGGTVLGVVTYNNKHTCVVTVKDEFGNERDLHYQNVSRIFPRDFFDF